MFWNDLTHPHFSCVCWMFLLLKVFITLLAFRLSWICSVWPEPWLSTRKIMKDNHADAYAVQFRLWSVVMFTCTYVYIYNYIHIYICVYCIYTCINKYVYLHSHINSQQWYSRRKFRSQTSDNMDRWKAEMGRVREKRRVEERRAEERRAEERRSEKRKSQKKEDAGARKGKKHHTTLHYTPIHSTTLHYTTHYTTLRYTTRH